MNKIRIKQIESGEFQFLIESLATGVVSRASGDIISYINSATERASGDIISYTNSATERASGDIISYINSATERAFRLSLSSGTDSVTGFYGFSSTGQINYILASSGVTDPIILSMVRSESPTGVILDFSNNLPSSNYYLNIHV